MKKKVNIRVLKKLEDSDLELPIKEFIKNILELESDLIRGSSYSERYRREIENTHINLSKLKR
jgi:hypothetical protein